jgi:hypothetical protein
MASQKFSYEDYLKDYEAIMRNQKLVNKLLKAPTQSKKKKSLLAKTDFDAAQPQVAQTYYKSKCKYVSKSLEKKRIATCSDSLKLTRTTSIFEAPIHPIVFITEKNIIKRFVKYVLAAEHKQ